MNARTVGLMVALVFGLAGCGGASSGGVPDGIRVTPFTEAHAAVFDDGVDFLSDPEVLDGRWREQWWEELDQRLRLADAVFVASIRTVSTDSDPARRTTYRIFVVPKASLSGPAPTEELSLDVREGDRAFGTVDGNVDRLLSGTYLAFIKYYQDDQGTVRAHWHLSPAEPGVVARIEYLIDRNRNR
jgi:hypothetical protein